MVKRKEAADGGIKVEVVELGNESRTFYVEEGASVGDVLEMAGYSAGTVAKVDGVEASASDEVEDGDLLVVTNKVKGGRA